ncbi:MAG: glycosyltransferase family 4 protein [Candidatus Hydrogenedentes bacterium]|nr:glycosyltransferase family 4 protein [Candidatus Hydrogenedentota bacterium]
MVVFSYYPADPRPRREAEALVDAGMAVDLICLRNEGELSHEVVNGVGVYRLPIQRKRAGKVRYLWEYALFILLAFFKLSALHLRRRYDVAHVHNMPDVLVFSALLPRLTGAKVILDLHDPMPEVYMTKYDIGADHPVIRTLRLFEKWSIAFSHLVLTPNIAFCDLFAARSCESSKVHVIMNSPDLRIFGGRSHAPSSAAAGAQFVVMFHGTIVERHGLDTALEAAAKLRNAIPELRFEVYGEGDFVERFQEIVRELKLEDIVHYHGRVSLEKIASAIPSINVGLVPNKRSVFTDINLPTRLFEYLCMGKPVIAPKTKGILDYFTEDALPYFDAGDVDSLAAVIQDLHDHPDRVKSYLERGTAIYEAHRWDVQREELIALVAALAVGPKMSSGPQ